MADYLGHMQAFKLAVEQCGGQAATAVFLDDSTRNVAAARKLGMFTVQVIACSLSKTDPVEIIPGGSAEFS